MIRRRWDYERARLAFEATGITHKRAAALLGIAERSIRYYLSGERVPTVDVAVDWAHLCDVSLDQLLSWERNGQAT